MSMDEILGIYSEPNSYYYILNQILIILFL